MANIDSITPAKKSHKGMRRHSTRVDMTPMVDLGFLLITFFIFTSVMAKPMSMKLITPVGKAANTPSAESKTLTLLLKEGGNVVCYEGFAKDNAAPKKIDLDKELGALRNIIQRKAAILYSHTKPDTLTVIIKPTMESDYNTLVRVMDEMVINQVHKYAVAPLDDDDKKLLDITH